MKTQKESRGQAMVDTAREPVQAPSKELVREPEPEGRFFFYRKLEMKQRQPVFVLPRTPGGGFEIHNIVTKEVKRIPKLKSA